MAAFWADPDFFKNDAIVHAGGGLSVLAAQDTQATISLSSLCIRREHWVLRRFGRNPPVSIPRSCQYLESLGMFRQRIGMQLLPCREGPTKGTSINSGMNALLVRSERKGRPLNGMFSCRRQINLRLSGLHATVPVQKFR